MKVRVLWAASVLVPVLAACSDAPVAPAASVAPELALRRTTSILGIKVLPESTTMGVTESMALAQKFVDGTGALFTLAGAPAPVWTSATPTTALVSPTGVVTAIAPGVAKIVVSQFGGLYSDTSNIVVGDSAAGGPNEPAGLTRITDRPFSAFAEDGWDNYETSQSNFKFVSDPTAPRSPQSVLNAVYPIGFMGGGSPATAQRRIDSGTNYHELYVSFWVKFSANWKGHSSGVNKILHLWVGGANRGVVAGFGSGSNPLQFQMRMQGIPDTRRPLVPNKVPTDQANFIRGQWQHAEVYIKLNTPGLNDGIVRWYLDGTLIGEVTDYEILGPTENWTWDQIQWSPTWGGGGDVVLAEQTMSMDHLYGAGR